MTVVTNPARIGGDAEVESNPATPSDSTEEENPNANHDRLPPSASVEEAYRLYDNEHQSDVVFVAGINEDTWRYPGHRRVLAATSPVFAALLATKADVVVVDYVDRRGFEQLMRYHYCEPTQLPSVTTARCALDAAYKFLCPPLAERCARRLDELLDAGVALEILRDMRYLCARLPGVASAPPLPALADDASAAMLAQCTRWCDSLAHNALLVLDEAADEALADERVEELPYEDLALLVRRETLRVSSELVLAEALARWSVAACKRAMHELTPGNRRKALGELAYCPRYLLLQGDELDRALRLELLDPVERALVCARSRRTPAPLPPVSAEQEVLLRRFAQPRPAAPADLPVHLSPRSQPPPEERRGLCGRRRRRRQGPDFGPVDERTKERGCCACFGDGLLRAFICLFD